MKKLLLIAATSTALLTSAASFAETGGFYLKAEGGAIRLNALKFKDDNDKSVSEKFKSTTSAIVGVGAGYYIMDNVRTELTLDFLTNPEFKCSKTINNVSVNAKAKESIRSLLLSGYVDLYDAGVVKIFAGAGIGMAQVQQKITWTVTPNGGGKANGDSDSFETANNFAYQLSVGASFNLADNMNLDLAYSWRDYGETGDVKGEENKKKKKETPKTAIRGHNLMAGIRFDL
ncbi:MULTISPECIES: outer membrane protein [unclassified Candidatus Tisiphia]|uniref:outer membrane protein n=1 Tax=unclassified Candidatus Tisiphia TaxID=2996318 RepID=UPI00312C7B13